MAIKRRIAFRVSSRALCLSGSRAVRATYFIASEPKKVPHGVHRMKKRWQPVLDSCGCPTSNHEMLHADFWHEPKSLIELEPLWCPASAKTNKAATKPSEQKGIGDDDDDDDDDVDDDDVVVLLASLAEQRRTGSKSQRTQISKSIRKHLRRALREQRNGRIEHVLGAFGDLDA